MMAIPMSTKKNKVRIIVAGSLAILLIAALCSWADGSPIEIQVAPNVLNINNQGEVVTVHTDIAYSMVTGSSVSLNGVDINSWKADSQGYFVAKFIMAEIKTLAGLNIGEFNTLILTGSTTNGSFSGSTEIMVIKNIPKK